MPTQSRGRGTPRTAGLLRKTANLPLIDRTTTCDSQIINGTSHPTCPAGLGTRPLSHNLFSRGGPPRTGLMGKPADFWGRLLFT